MSVEKMADLLRETEEYHAVFEKFNPAVKHDWVTWYARFMVGRQGGMAAGEAAWYASSAAVIPVKE